MTSFIKVEELASCLFSVLCNKPGTDHNHFSVGKWSYLPPKERCLLQGPPGELPCAQHTCVQGHPVTSIGRHGPRTPDGPALGASAELHTTCCTCSSKAAHSKAVSCAHSTALPWYSHKLGRYWQLWTFSLVISVLKFPIALHLSSCLSSWLSHHLLYQNESMALSKGLTTKSSKLNERKQN